MMKVKYTVYLYEKFYFFIRATISMVFYIAFFAALVDSVGLMNACLLFPLCLLVVLCLVGIASIFLGGVIKGNAVKASPKQFKEVFDIVNEQSKALGLQKAPKVYVLHVGGWINAFAARFLRNYYVVLFAPVLEEAYQDGEETLRFIVGHELGHIKRSHLGFWKLLLTLPASGIPLLQEAYSRACEYTCDRIGYALAPDGASTGMGLLAVGPRLSRKLNMQAWLSDGKEELGFATAFTELFATHPHLINRMRALDLLRKEKGK